MGRCRVVSCNEGRTHGDLKCKDGCLHAQHALYSISGLHFMLAWCEIWQAKQELCIGALRCMIQAMLHG